MGPYANALLAVAVGGVAAIVGNIAATKIQAALPAGAPTWSADALRVLGGVAGAAALAKHHPAIGAGIGVGLGAPAAVKLVTPLLPQSLQAVVMEGASAAVMGDYVDPTNVRRLGDRIGRLEAVVQEALDYGT